MHAAAACKQADASGSACAGSGGASMQAWSGGARLNSMARLRRMHTQTGTTAAVSSRNTIKPQLRLPSSSCAPCTVGSMSVTRCGSIGSGRKPGTAGQPGPTVCPHAWRDHLRLVNMPVLALSRSAAACADAQARGACMQAFACSGAHHEKPDGVVVATIHLLPGRQLDHAPLLLLAGHPVARHIVLLGLRGSQRHAHSFAQFPHAVDVSTSLVIPHRCPQQHQDVSKWVARACGMICLKV